MTMTIVMKLWVTEEEASTIVAVVVVVATVMTLMKMIVNVEMVVPHTDVDSMIVVVKNIVVRMIIMIMIIMKAVME